MWLSMSGRVNISGPGILKIVLNYPCVFSCLYSMAAVPNLFGTRDQCCSENLMPDDLRWS